MGKWTRRAFITSGVLAGGVLAVGVALRPGHRAPKLAGAVTSGDEVLVSSWVKIDASNKVTLIAAHGEMGQGTHTALVQILADEMDARWDDVQFMEAPPIDGYANGALGRGFILGDKTIPRALVPTVDGAFQQIANVMHLQITGGSSSIRATGVHGVRIAGAAVREMLLSAAAAQWGVGADELTARDTQVIHEASGRSAPFAEFAEAASQFTPSHTPTLKNSGQFRVMGKDKARRDIPSKVDGSARFGIDADIPDMKYAAIMAAPVFGARVASVSSTAAEAMPGVYRVVQLEDAVAVVADGYWQASQALAAVDVSWTETENDTLDSRSLFERFEADLSAAEDPTVDREQGDLESAFTAAAETVEATYRVPYLAHACMEPMNATARFEGGRCEVWSGSQNPLGFRYEIAEALDIDVENVDFHQHYMGGGFGRRAFSDPAVQAAKIARASGVPVKLIWSREEDVRHDLYRPAVASQFRAALDGDGVLTAWDHIYHGKTERTDSASIPYAVPNQRVRHIDSPSHVPTGPWRSVDHSQQGFFGEAFFDEMAAAAGRDPYLMRMELLEEHPRHRGVLEKAAQMAGWGRELPAGRGMGIALQASFGSIVAQVVEVSVTQGKLTVERVSCAIDPGFAVSPAGVVAQMQSGIVYGLTAALYGEINIESGAVQQSNFHDYPMLRYNDCPEIDVQIINSGEAWGGAGEPGTPPIAPALVSAVYAATGIRVRELPLANTSLV
jgi:isoquinoline 1-oxidoreductase beta subunit